MTTIAIITPSFNQGSFIEQTILSVLSQNIPHLDYVVIDGGSQDETLDILKRYSHQLRFISEADRGQAHAVNKGIIMTSSDIIGWLNSDDIYYPNAIRDVISYFEQHSEVDVLYGQANHINFKNQLIEKYPTEPWDIERFKNICFISQPSVFFRRRVIDRCGLLNEQLHFCLDYEYWIRAALAGVKFAHIPIILAGTRLYPETKTMSFPEEAQKETIAMLKKQLKHLPVGWIISRSVFLVKKKTKWRKHQWQFILLVFAIASFLNLKHNGFIKGLKPFFYLPFGMIALSKKGESYEYRS